VNGWREMSLGDFVGLQRGHDLTEGERRPGHVPVMGSAGMNGCHDTAKAKGPGVVVGRSGASFGQVHFCPVDYWPHNTALYVTDFRGNDTRFAYYFLKSLDFSRYNSGSAQPSLNRNFIAPIQICVPEPKEQKAIASVVGSLDDKIELNRRMNETLEALAQSLFKSWFVDATLSALPKGWRETTLDELAAISGGKQLPTEECKPSGKITVFGANGIMGYADRATHEGFVIAFGRVGAYCGSIHWSHGGAWINNNASSVIPHRWPEFVLQAMLNVPFDSMRTGSAQPFIPNSALSAAKIIRPADDILDSYCSIVRPLRLKQTQNEAESRTLAALRDALLPKLLSGELRVPAKLGSLDL